MAGGAAGAFGGAGGTGLRASGGGGAALGGAIFVAKGGELTFYDPKFIGNYGVTGGAAGVAGSAAVQGGAGRALGEIMFLDGDTTLNLTDDAIISHDDAIAGSGELRKTTSHTLTLAGGNANFTGKMVVSGGDLRLQNGGALGDTAAGTVVTYGSISLEGGISVLGEKLELSAKLQNISGDNRWGGDIRIHEGEFVNDAGTLTISGKILGSAEMSSQLEIKGAGATLLTGEIADTRITKWGSGTLTLSGANTASQWTEVFEGVLRVTHAKALGTVSYGVNVGTGAALELSGGIAIAGLSLTVDGTGVTNGGALRNVSGVNSWSGALTVSSPTSIAADAGSLTLSGEINADASDLTFSGAADISVAGEISGSGKITKSGAGSLTLAADNASFIGEVHVADGVLIVADSAALGGIAQKTFVHGTGTLSLTGGVQVASEALDLSYGGVLRNISGANAWGGDIEVKAAANYATVESLSGTLTLAGTIFGEASALFVTGAGATVISGVISELDGVDKQGAGNLTLSGANTFDGTVDVSAGVLRVAHAQALGTVAQGTTVSSGAALELSGDVAVAGEVLTISGLGVSNGGALRNVSGTNSWSGALNASGATSITASAGSLTLSGAFNAGANGVHFGGAGAITVSGAISGAGGEFTKTGAGVLTLSGVNTTAADFDVLAGKLVVDGSIGSRISVSGGATLGGTGTVGDVTVTSGTLAAGNSAGILSTGDINLTFSSALAVEIGGTTAGIGGYDQIDVTGLVTLAGDLDVSFLGGFSPTSGTFTIINNDGTDAVSGTFDGLAEGATFDIGATRFTISYVGGVDSNDVVLTASTAPVVVTPPSPEPTQPTQPTQPSMTPEDIRQAFTGSNGFNPGAAKTAQATITLPDGRVVENPNYKAAAALEQLIVRFTAGLINEANLADQVADLAAPTSAVALQAYQFFTGRTPGKPGMAWLVDSLDNANDLTDPYYAGFNTANRYINFAVNLGVQGEGRSGFEAGYGALDFTAAVRKAYDAIIGLDEAKAAGLDVDAAIAWVVSQKGYFDALGGSALGGKAAMVGYLMFAGFDADVGIYSDATHDWLVDAFNGQAAYGVDMVGQAGMSFADDIPA
ncbi:autotransporter-associated beta strand repeat-containing protein [Caulobacter sp. 73W]|uniref:Autotransporter-associated beta strand repeat-containing protein n=1 Tax=Caulobacter sp. 73W TaxID=3161137 RepID=A0AB39KZ92_9CAUL